MSEQNLNNTNPETVLFWQAAAERRLLVKRCLRCEKTHFYPRNICPHCFSQDTEWLESSGQGTIYSFTVMRKAETPFALVYVRLEEGVTLLSHLVDCDLDAIAIGQSVRVDYREKDDRMLVVFKLAEN